MSEYTTRPPSKAGKGDASGYSGPSGPGRTPLTPRAPVTAPLAITSGIDTTTLGFAAVGAALLFRKKSKKR